MFHGSIVISRPTANASVAGMDLPFVMGMIALRGGEGGPGATGRGPLKIQWLLPLVWGLELLMG